MLEGWSAVDAAVDTTGARPTDLASAMRDLSLVQVSRFPRNADRLVGFVVALGSKWALLVEAADGGYSRRPGCVSCARRRRGGSPRDFEEKFARSQPGWPPRAPTNLNLEVTSDLVKSLGAAAPLIAIEQEDRFNSAMQWTGVVDEVVDGWLWLHEVRPDASWRDEPLGYKLSRISKLTVGRGYLRALAEIAGSAPEPT